MPANSAISIYIHWPFCLSLCPYCDFNSHQANSIDHQKWLEAYKTELAFFTKNIQGRKIRSIFFGGGTPSLMPPSIVGGIIDQLAKIGEISADTEITLEANPTSYETTKFQEFKSCGINRVSIGVQSFSDKSLQILGRKHSSDDAIKSIESANNLFPRFSFDLIYARPDQNLQDWQKELKFAMKLANGHISLYQLTIEKGTAFFKLYKTGQITLPPDKIAADMYDWTNNYLNDIGYQRYEISNYAVKDDECLHNLCYWNYDEYLGIGPGAHSRLHYENHIESVMMLHKPDKWLNSVFDNGAGIQNRIKLDSKDIITESIMMGSRLTSGIDKNKFKRLTKHDLNEFLNQKLVKQYHQQGLVSNTDKKLKFTDKGMILHNYLISRMVDV